MGAGGSVANSTQDERVQRAGQLYRLLDGDGTGDVDVAELRASFVKMRGGAGAGEDALVTALFDQLDKDHSGSVSLAEFEEVARSLQRHPQTHHAFLDHRHGELRLCGTAQQRLRRRERPLGDRAAARLRQRLAHALDALSTSRVRRVVMVGRRGSAQAAFSPKELRELLGLPGVEVKVADPACMRLEPEDEADLDASRPRRRAREAIVKALTKAEAAEADEGGDARVVSEKKTLEFRFLRSPERFEASGDEPGAVGAVTLRVNALRGASGARRAEATEATETLSDVALALRSVGYVARPVTGEDSFKSYVPFDPKRGVVPNHLGRVQEQVAETVWQVPGLYVAGWLKRGPTGIIGTNLHDAEETVGSIVEDDERGILRRPDYRFKGKGVAPLLRTRGVVVVDKEGWRRIDAKERERGAEAGKPREKFVDVAEMLDAAAAGEPEKATA